MKKFLVYLLAWLMVFNFGSVFATTTGTESGEVIYLDDYSQYEELIGSIDYQEEYKAEYNKMVADDITSYNEAVREKSYRAKVLEASDVQVKYGQHPYYYYYYKTSYQVLKIKILEDGEYKDREIEKFSYVLTCDTYENVVLDTVQKGDIINVTLAIDEKGNLAANIVSYDAPRERWQAVFILILIGVLLVAIYTGKHSAKFLVPLVLIIDLLFLVFLPTVIEGINIMFLTGIIVILSTIVICVLKLGIRTETFVAMLSTCILTFFLILSLYCFDAITGLCGITHDTTHVMEYIMPEIVDGEIENKMNFHDFSIAITTLMMYFGIVSMSTETAKLYASKPKSRNKIEEVNDAMKETLADRMLLIFGVLIVPMISKVLLLVLNKCSLVELFNSEVLITEVVRVVFVLIGMSLAVPITSLVSRLSEE